MVMQILISYRTSSTKYQAIMNQVNEYMRHKKLPMEMQKKLTTYYEYKYKKRYFREMGITEALSGNLRILHTSQNSIFDVEITSVNINILIAISNC